MEVEILEDNNNAVIGRREIELSIIQDDRTPTREEVKRETCKKLNLNPDSTLVVTLLQSYGLRQSRAIVHSYPNPAAMKKFEHSYLFERHEKKNKKEAGGDAAPVKEEKKEGKKEEKATEQKK
jgi:ribosomal protein S24E